MGRTPPGEPAIGSRTTGVVGLTRSPRSLRSMSFTLTPRTILSPLAFTVVLAVVAVGCGGGSDQSAGIDTTTTTVTVVPGLDYPLHSDPRVPISVGLSRRFAIALPSDPESGWHWTSEPVDQVLLAPLGSEFRDDPKLLASIPLQTTTTVSSLATGPTTTSLSIPAAPAPLVQVISFAARGLGSTTLRFRYSRIGSSGQDPTLTATFIVTIVPYTSPATTAVPVPLP